jgi:nicotinamidase-related amidase
MQPANLRKLAGVPPVVAIAARHTALLLIDFQREYLDGALPLNAADASSWAAELMQAADRLGMLVAHVHQVAAHAGAALFRPGSAAVAPWPQLRPLQRHLVVEKRLPSAFAGTALDEALRRAGIDLLVLAGLMTHMCVDSTARDAVHRGYLVVVACDACATRDLPGTGGAVIPARVVHEATLAALADRFADVVETQVVIGNLLLR